MARQKAMGIVPQDTRMPARNDGVKAWEEHSRRRAARLHAAASGLRRHARSCRPASGAADRVPRHGRHSRQHLDPGAVRQRREPGGRAARLRQRDGAVSISVPSRSRKSSAGSTTSAGRTSHSNFPHGWAMASNTPLRRYKQNTHGGGIRDPFVMNWPNRIAAKGELRHQFVHACDLTPTLLELIGIEPPAEIARLPADADGRRELCALDHRCGRAVKILAAIFRDVRPSRHLAGRLEGGLLPSVGHAVRERQMGAVSSRPGFFRDRRSRREGAGAAGRR